MNKTIDFMLTEDGSPTACFNDSGSENYQKEKMHHSGGAFGESVYIYGPAIQWGFSKVEEPRILSLGTGIAYNEILAAAFSIIFEAPLKLTSYEANSDLNEDLVSWLKHSKSLDPTFSTFKIVPFEIYDSILEFTAKLFEIPGEKIKTKMRQSYEMGDWKICGAWDARDVSQYNVIIYDFFSSKAMESFWSEEFLVNFLKANAAKQCAFATYACTGKLKRAFRANNFNFFQRKGYLWKRSSTFATKNFSSKDLPR